MKISEEIYELYRTKLEYFTDCFEFKRCNRYRLVEDNYPLNPHSILRMIIDEIKFNGNKRNLKFLQKEFVKIMYNDPILRKYKYYIENIKQHIIQNKEYALQLCFELISKIEYGKYGIELCKHIKNVIFDEADWQNCKKELQYLSTSLIIELEIYGYSEKYIENFCGNLLSSYNEHNGIYYTNYIFLPDYVEQNNDKIPAFFEELSIQKRLEDMEYAFRKKDKNYVFVCALTGIKGSELDIRLKDVNIYNTKYIKKYNFENSDDFLHKKLNEKDIHVSVNVNCVDIDKAEIIAKEKIEKAIDVICCYSKSQVPIKIDFTEVVILDDAGHICRSSSTIKGTEFERDVKGLNFDYDDKDELEEIYARYSNVVLNSKLQIATAIQDSGRWYRKGEDAERKEDKLINYWISIENLLPNDWILPQELKTIKEESDNKFIVIYSMIPNLFIIKHVLNELWIYYNYFYNKYRRKGKAIPDELIDECQFGHMGNINILKFLLSIDELIVYIDNTFDKEILHTIKDNITVNSSRYVDKIISKIENNILLSYRLRNMIVHNAKCNMNFSEYYIYNLRRYAEDLYYLIVEEYNQGASDSIKDIIFRQYIKQKERNYHETSILDYIKDM